MRARVMATGLALGAVLLATACARVPTHVTLPTLALGEPSFFPTLEAYAGSPIVQGNRVELLLNGAEIFPTQIDAVKSARISITLAQYYWGEGPIGRLLAEALTERCRAGVKAHVLLDGYGSVEAPPAQLESMRAAGCEVVFFRPLNPTTVNRVNNRNHRRVMVIDGQVGFTGGSGVDRRWMGDGRTADHWRETDVRVEGPVIRYLQGAFAENWLEATGVVLGGDDYFPAARQPGRMYAQVVRSSPAGGGMAMYTTFLLAIASAQRSILITNPYFLPDDKFIDALAAAARRGVRVAILGPGPLDHGLVRWAARRHFGRLLRAGIEIHEYRAALLHSKTMVIDSIWSTVGSTNLDNRSFALNDELNVVVYDREFARRLETVFSDDLTYSVVVTYDTWRKRGIGQRLMEWLSLPLTDNL
jgi:cardiolipin synthase A/B